MKLHLHWTTEQKTGQCPECKGETVLIVSHDIWEAADEELQSGLFADGVETGLEITGHWCPECREMRSIAVNGS